MKFATVSAVLIAGVSAASTKETSLTLPAGATLEHISSFFTWAEGLKREYKDSTEQHERFKTWFENLKFIETHNSENHSYNVGMNEFGDFTNEEFMSKFNNYKSSQRLKATTEPYSSTSSTASSVDWVTKGAVTPVKNQGSCGSCYTFSTTGSIEGQWALNKGELISLSEQQILDCSSGRGSVNDGCNGGLMDDSFKYIESIGGIELESSYPYTGTQGTCQANSRSNFAAQVTGYKDVTKGSEAALTSAIQNVGPISIAIDASQLSFQFYKSGVYNQAGCSTSKLDHAVLAVGYGSDSGTPYYLVKNSWGTSWGEQGYIKMTRDGSNQCGVASEASYPLV